VNTSAPSSSRARRARLLVFTTIVGLIVGMFAAGGAAASASADATGIVSGTVFGSTAPTVGLAGAYVDLYIPNEQTYALTTTDQNGNFSFTGVPAGSYTLDFQSPTGSNFTEQWWNDQPNNASATYFNLADGQALGGLNATLVVGATLSGSVYGAGAPNVPLPFSNVYVSGLGGAPDAFASTDSNGNFTLTGISAGTYSLHFSPPFNSGNYLQQWWNDQPTQATATTITIGAAQNLTGYNAVLSVGASISGTVTGADTGLGLPGGYVQALQSGNPVGFANVSSTGTYDVSGLEPGSYILQFVPANGTNYVGQYWNDASTAATATPITVSAGDVDTGYNAALAVGATVSGTVTTVDAAGVGLAGASVTAVDSSDSYVAGTTTDTNGNYSIVGLATGSYRIQFQAPYGDSHASQFWKNAATFGKATAVAVSATTVTSGINASLTAGATISGTVVDTGTPPAPIAYAIVEAHTSSGAYVASTEADQNGNYTLANLPAGTFVVEFDGTDGGAYVSSWWQNASKLSAATRIKVALGATITGIDGSMAPAYLTPGHPTISGAAKVGSTLTSKPGNWKPSDTTFVYQWNRDGSPITGATAATYVPVNADAGHTLSVTITGDRYHFNDVTVTSPSTKVVTGGTLTAPVPQIVGTPVRGSTLSIVPGTWGPGTVTLSYRWSRAGNKIAGATNPTYTVTKADAGKTITVSVTGSELGFTTTTQTSLPTTPAS
jgi:hypothetical protein